MSTFTCWNTGTSKDKGVGCSSKVFNKDELNVNALLEYFDFHIHFNLHV